MKGARAFAALHRRGIPLVLCNVWDAASARIVQAAGAPAVATGSAGVSYALGYADGEQVPPDEMFAAIARIARVLDVPLSADVEAGYGSSPDQVVATMQRVLDAGAVGVNVEDWDVPRWDVFPVDHARDRIAAIKQRFGDALFVNARTDMYLHDVGDPARRLEATIERLRAFEAAGADGVFVPGTADPRIIGALVKTTALPLNVLAGPSMPPVADLARLGVARVSTGSWPMRSILAETRAIAFELRDRGTFAFTERAIPYAEMNALFGER